jgi:hypothetical protein
MNDGSTLDLEPGELFGIPSGHDAWVVGDDPCRLLEWGGKLREPSGARRARHRRLYGATIILTLGLALT